MRRLIDRCAGIDVGQALLVVCVRVVDEKGRLDQQIRSFGATTPDLLDLRDWLAAAAVTHVAMESTGVYWKAPYYLLEDEFEVLLVNAAHLKHVPGRKTDVIDAQWIAEVLSYGLLRPSFVPPRPFRELRDLTRYRNALIRARTREVNRLHKRSSRTPGEAGHRGTHSGRFSNPDGSWDHDRRPAGWERS
jgi:transposase